MELCVSILLVSTIPYRRYRIADLPCSEGGRYGDKKKMKTKNYQNQYQLLALSYSSSSSPLVH